jgi:ABC-type branched-subunit amino acid transport system substrate-binding protein
MSWTGKGHARRGGRLLAAIAVLAAAATLVAACGGGDSDSSTSSGASSGGTASTAKGPKLSGEPIKAMTIAAVNWNGPAYPNILETAKLYEKWINDHGGIKGRPLKVETCDEQGDPNQLAACGRKAISNHDVAVVGSYTVTGDRIVPVLEKGKTAWFGVCCAGAQREVDSPMTFGFSAGLGQYAAYGVKAADMGCKKPALIISDVPGVGVYTTFMNNVLKARGLQLSKTVKIPLQAADYTPQVAQATTGTDCLIAPITEVQWASMLPPLQQSGAKVKLVGAQGNLDEKVAKSFPEVTEGAQIIGTFPDISTPAFKDYRDAIATYKPPSDLDYNSLGGLGTWAGYSAFKQVVESIQGPVTNLTFLAAANKAKLKMGGMTPDVDFTQPWKQAPLGIKRQFNNAVTYAVMHDGKPKVEQPGFFDMKKWSLIAAGPPAKG